MFQFVFYMDCGIFLASVVTQSKGPWKVAKCSFLMQAVDPNSELVCVHDSARPLVLEGDVKKVGLNARPLYKIIK